MDFSPVSPLLASLCSRFCLFQKRSASPVLYLLRRLLFLKLYIKEFTLQNLFVRLTSLTNLFLV